VRIEEIMTPSVRLVRPDQTVEEAAKMMAEEDLGFLPVADDEKLVGIITDRDITVRVIAEGRDGRARIGDVMTDKVKYCYADQSVDEVVANMGDLQVRRLPVVSREKRLVGIVSLADAARDYDAETTGEALTEVVEPGGRHNQKK
jgi:CBS domain-containing protein